jgi:uncharacterized membrane protein YhaH (DUF805 family)
MSFAEALHAGFDKAFVFSGRASRPEYWWFVLFFLLSFVTLSVVTALSFPQALSILPGLFALVMAVPLAAAGFRRMQDTGRTGWLSLVWIVGSATASGGRLIGSAEVEFLGEAAALGMMAMILYWQAQPGRRGPNAFGPDPLGRG